MALQIKRRKIEVESECITTKTVTKRKTLGARKPMSTQKQLRSRISLWNVDSDNQSAPIARGVAQITAEVVEELYELIQEGAEFVELGVSIWETDSANERAPAFTGLIKSPSERADELEAANANKNKKSSGGTTRRRKQ